MDQPTGGDDENEWQATGIVFTEHLICEDSMLSILLYYVYKYETFTTTS